MNIIQTWKTKEPPIHYHGFIHAIQKLNPDWTYIFFDDDDIEYFIKTKVPEYSETFYGLAGKIQQIDFFRYLAIYYYGGLYLDLDIKMNLPLDMNVFSMDKPTCIFPVEQRDINDLVILSQGVDYLVGNYAFYATKGHPFIKQIIDNIVTKRISENDIKLAQYTCTDDVRDVYVYYRTGPILVTQSYIDYSLTMESNYSYVTLLEPEPYKPDCFGQFGEHHCYGSWRHVRSAQTPLSNQISEIPLT